MVIESSCQSDWMAREDLSVGLSPDSNDKKTAAMTGFERRAFQGEREEHVKVQRWEAAPCVQKKSQGGWKIRERAMTVEVSSS